MMLTKILAGVATGSALLAGFVASRPSEFHVERSIDVAAPPARVAAHVNDFRAWTAWSPWEKKDPALKRTYSGPPSGEGASYAWEGNADVGEGRMTIERTSATETRVRLEFLKPFAATNTATYSFVPAAGGTRVTWGMDGEAGFVAKAFHLFFDMDALVGKDFEQGLAALKTAAETTQSTARAETKAR
jgi:hypothetical protein